MAKVFHSSSIAFFFVLAFFFSFTNSVHGYDNVGCPSNSSADSLRVLSEYLLHRPADSFGELFFDEDRSVLLFTVFAELWRIPIRSRSTQVFVCNSTSQSFENARAYAVDTTTGYVHLGATESLTRPVLHSLDYNGLQLTERSSMMYIPYVGAYAGAPTSILFHNGTKLLVVAFRDTGIVLLNASNPLQPSAVDFIRPVAYGNVNITSCMLHEASSRAFCIAQNYTSPVLIQIQLQVPPTVPIFLVFQEELSNSEETIGIIAPENGNLFLANSNISQFIQLKQGGSPTFFNLTEPGAYFHTVASDPFRKRIYYFTSNPETPIYMFQAFDEFPYQGPLRTPTLYYDTYQAPITTYATRNLTVYRAYFAKYQDLAFFVADPLDQSANVNIVAVSTSSCPDANSVCSQTSQGNCGCTANELAQYPVMSASCSNYLYNETERQYFPYNVCPNNPQPTQPIIPAAAPVSSSPLLP